MLNEVSYVEQMASDLAAQDFAGEVEVIVADGGSTDGSAELLLAAAERLGLALRIVDNPAGWVSHGLNACVREARGDLIVRADCHSRYPPECLRRCAETSEATGADSSRIVLRWSADGGRSWSPRLDVTDDPAAKPDQHDHVTLAWLPGGALFAGWRDRRCCGGTFDDRYQQWVRVLEPGGSGALVPGRTLELSDGPQPGNTADGRAQLQPDEFQGLVATAQGVGLTWSQLTGTYTDLMFRRVPLRAFGLGHSSVARVRPLRPRRPSARPR